MLIHTWNDLNSCYKSMRINRHTLWDDSARYNHWLYRYASELHQNILKLHAQTITKIPHIYTVFTTAANSTHTTMATTNEYYYSHLQIELMHYTGLQESG